MKIFILRHGITEASLIDTALKNVSLSKNGIRQINDVLDLIPNNICHIYTSPMIRTIETSRIIQEKLGCDIIIDDRLKNKLDDEHSDYYENLGSFLNDINDDDDILIVTHGRNIKMLYSIINFKRINPKIMKDLDIDYGDLFCFEKVNNVFIFREWKRLNNNLVS